MPTNLAISVEGPTEVNFVKHVLIPWLKQTNPNVFIKEISLMRGGISLSSVRKEWKKLTHGKQYDKVTSLYDFYGFDNKGGCKDNKSLQKLILDDLSNFQKKKIIPYVQMYEFEGLLFSEPMEIGNILADDNAGIWANTVLKGSRKGPETINNSYATTPKHRLEENTNYIETTHGHLIAKAIGIEKIKEECPNFKEWVEILEKL